MAELIQRSKLSNVLTAFTTSVCTTVKMLYLPFLEVSKAQVSVLFLKHDMVLNEQCSSAVNGSPGTGCADSEGWGLMADDRNGNWIPTQSQSNGKT